LPTFRTTARPGEAAIGAIDAAAHVIETDHLWDYLERADRKLRPRRCWTAAGSLGVAKRARAARYSLAR